MFLYKVNNLLKQQRVHQLVLMGMLLLTLSAKSQFPPAAELPGSTAIAADSPTFVAWASRCDFIAGWMDITREELGVVNYGLPEYATQSADNQVLSLGDGGVATCFFNVPISDGAGWDFAVFENSFDDAFLELAFVEVSSDGEFFVRFPSTSLTQAITQIETFGTLEATQLNNLAGKYRGGYGVPFDLNELSGIQGLDIAHVVAVRIVDVVGNILPEWASFDANDNRINDPWPTAFETGGFDLDAVGVIHNQDNTDVISLNESAAIRIFPNPVHDHFSFESEQIIESLVIFNASGKQVYSAFNVNSLEIVSQSWSEGIYIVKVLSDSHFYTFKIVK